MDTLEKKLTGMFGPVIESMVFELVAVEIAGGGNTILRIYIDSPDGITVDDCTDVSYQISGLLDVEDPLRGKYTLEVSSPGLNRPLVTLDHFKQFTGERVKIRRSSRRVFVFTTETSNDPVLATNRVSSSPDRHMSRGF